MGIGCDVIRVEIEEGLSKDHLLETFINCGRTFFITLLDLLILYQSFYQYQMVGVYNQPRMLCCAVSGFLVCVEEPAVGRCVVVVLEGLERAHSLSHLLENLCEALENRGSFYSLSLNHSETLMLPVMGI